MEIICTQLIKVDKNLCWYFGSCQHFFQTSKYILMQLNCPFFLAYKFHSKFTVWAQIWSETPKNSTWLNNNFVWWQTAYCLSCLLRLKVREMLILHELCCATGSTRSSPCKSPHVVQPYMGYRFTDTNTSGLYWNTSGVMISGRMLIVPHFAASLFSETVRFKGTQNLPVNQIHTRTISFSWPEVAGVTFK